METNFTNIKERILYYTDIKGFTKEKFFEELGVTYGNFKGKAKEKALSSDILAKIVSKYPEINPEWLLTGRGEMFKQPQGYTTEQTPPLIAAEGKSDYSNNTEVELLRKQVELLEENRLLHQEIKQLQERINGLEQENYAIQKQLQNRAAG